MEQKSKDMSIDFRKSSSSATMAVIKGEILELEEHEDYLGTAVDSLLFLPLMSVL